MDAPFVVCKEVNDFKSSYSTKEKITFFRSEKGISSLDDENMIVLEVCSP